MGRDFEAGPSTVSSGDLVLGGLIVAALAALFAVVYRYGRDKSQTADGRPPDEMRGRLASRLWITVVAITMVVLAVAAEGDAFPLLIVLSWGLPLAFVGFVVWAGVRIIRLLEDIKRSLRELSDRDRLP